METQKEIIGIIDAMELETYFAVEVYNAAIPILNYKIKTRYFFSSFVCQMFNYKENPQSVVNSIFLLLC